jgi:aspartate/methionine/tyrosine aminotransferase
VRYADRLDSISPFRVMELMERARYWEAQGRRVVHFEVGEPDFNTAQPILEAGKRALDEGHTKYTLALGTTELRTAIAGYYDGLGVAVDPAQVVVTAGASGGLLLLCALLLSPGDELLITDPGYPCNEAVVRSANGTPRRIAVSPTTGFRPGPADVAAHWNARSRALLIASPANPTGAVLEADRLAALAQCVRALGGVMILDEIYQGLTYGEGSGYATGLAVVRDLVVLNSFSKYFGMTGWRLGWLVVPEAWLDGLSRLAQNLFISPSSVAQRAALAAFTPEAMAVHEARRLQFDGRRATLLAGLRALGFGIPVEPAGAFYLYADIAGLGIAEANDATAFSRRLIDEYQVAVTPGIDFGAVEASHHVRFAYTTSDDSIALGLERIAAALEAWRRAG